MIDIWYEEKFKMYEIELVYSFWTVKDWDEFIMVSKKLKKYHSVVDFFFFSKKMILSERIENLFQKCPVWKKKPSSSIIQKIPPIWSSSIFMHYDTIVISIHFLFCVSKSLSPIFPIRDFPFSFHILYFGPKFLQCYYYLINTYKYIDQIFILLIYLIKIFSSRENNSILQQRFLTLFVNFSPSSYHIPSFPIPYLPFYFFTHLDSLILSTLVNIPL